MYSIHPASRTNSPELVAFVCAEFLAGSVLHQALDISLAEYTGYMADPMGALLSEELSFVAIDESDGSIAGCILAAEYQPLHLSRSLAAPPVPEFAKPIKAILSELEERYESTRPDHLQSALLVDIAVVVPRARGQGVYARLRHAVHQRALERSYSVVLGELSSVASQRLCVHKLGHKVICEIPYKTFEYAGRYPFSSIDTPASIQMVEGVLR